MEEGRKRLIKDITEEEIKEVNKILESEYCYSGKLKNASEIEYQCFKKSRSIFSGMGVIRVYEYLNKVNINLG
tara:strand:- start:125 stop:343 length:219 start_codon:yes stop_codon:yes gene_type:complete